MTPPPTTATSNVLLRSRNVSLPAPALPGSGSDGRRILVSALSAQAGGAPVDANPSAPVLPDFTRGRKTPTAACSPSVPRLRRSPRRLPGGRAARRRGHRPAADQGRL